VNWRRQQQLLMDGHLVLAVHQPEQEVNTQVGVQNNYDVERLTSNKTDRIHPINNINNNKQQGMKVVGKRTANQLEAAVQVDYWLDAVHINQ
jgi:hypothetical protein